MCWEQTAEDAGYRVVWGWDRSLRDSPGHWALHVVKIQQTLFEVKRDLTARENGLGDIFLTAILDTQDLFPSPAPLSPPHFTWTPG